MTSTTAYWLCVVFLLLTFRIIIDELWTILQIIKSFFVKPLDLKRKYGDWAVVTGCTDGIGKAYAFQLAERGINIVLISRSPTKLSDVANELMRKHQIKTKIIVADFTEGMKVFPLIKKELADIEVGILVNNVGITSYYPMYYCEFSEKEISDVMNVNFGTMMQMTRIILPGMVERKRGAIVNMSSTTKLMPIPLTNLYSGSKIFVDYFSEALRDEYGNCNITIQLLCPFFVSTKIIEFSDALRQTNLFVPDPYTYASQAVKTLGVIDNTTGYWPHRLQYAVILLASVWLRSFVAGIIGRKLRSKYLKDKSE